MQPHCQVFNKMVDLLHAINFVREKSLDCVRADVFRLFTLAFLLKQYDING